MILKLTYYGNPILRKKCAPVEEITDEIRQLVADMEETMNAQDGIGLAAPQVGHALAIFVRNIPVQTSDGKWAAGTTEVFINPKILSYSEEEACIEEGCLSIPGFYAPVWRPVSIKVEATDLEGKRFVKEYKDLYARNILHENDHLNGVLYIDRIHGKERKELDKLLRDIKKKYAGK